MVVLTFPRGGVRRGHSVGVLLDSPFFLRRRGASRLTWDGVVVSRSPGDASGGGVLLGASLGVAGADVMVALRTASRGVLCAWGLHLGRGQECLGGIHRVCHTGVLCGVFGKALFWGIRRSYRLSEVLHSLWRMGGRSGEVLGGSPPCMSESLCGISAPERGMFWSLRGRNGDVLSRSSLDMAGRIAERGQFLEESFKGE